MQASANAPEGIKLGTRDAALQRSSVLRDENTEVCLVICEDLQYRQKCAEMSVFSTS